MFTSRAEYRTLLRQDNADERLTHISHKIGLASEERLNKVKEKLQKRNELLKFLKNKSFTINEANNLLVNKKENLVNQTDKYSKLLARPNISRSDLNCFGELNSFINKSNMDDSIFEQAEIEIKYSGYIEKEKRNADKLKRLENIKIPANFNFNKLASLSLEAKEKLNSLRPETLAQASRISGVNPSDISVLLVSMGR